MAEKVFLDENSVKVTNSRFVVPSQTYAMSGITSVKAVIVTPKRTVEIVLFLLGLIMVIFSGGNFGSVFGGVLFMAGGVVLWILRKAKHIVKLSTSSGEAEALGSTDGNFILKVVKAVNDAIVERG